MKRIVLALALAASVGGSVSFPATAQQDPVGDEAAYKPPRGPDGKPDLSGVWQVMNTANWDIEPHAARAALAFRPGPDRKSTRLNSSHVKISYAVFCLKKKKI